MAEELLELGRVHKAHGLRGEVSVSFISNRPERWSVGASLKVGDAWMTVASSRAHQGRTLIRFEGIADRLAAEVLSGARVYGAPLVDPDALWIHEMIGARVLDQDGIDHGIVKAVLENPASDLLVLEDGALVPLAFVTQVEVESSTIRVDVPPGLFETA